MPLPRPSPPPPQPPRPPGPTPPPRRFHLHIPTPAARVAFIALAAITGAALAATAIHVVTGLTDFEFQPDVQAGAGIVGLFLLYVAASFVVPSKRRAS